MLIVYSQITASLMSGFHHSVAVLQLPFRCDIPLYRSVLPFRSYRCRCGWERKCWKRLSVCIWMRPERCLVVRLRQNRKNRIRSHCYGTAVTAQWQVAMAAVQRNFQRNSYRIYVTGMAKRQRQNGNGMVEIRHNMGTHLLPEYN